MSAATRTAMADGKVNIIQNSTDKTNCPAVVDTMFAGEEPGIVPGVVPVGSRMIVDTMPGMGESRIVPVEAQFDSKMVANSKMAADSRMVSGSRITADSRRALDSRMAAGSRMVSGSAMAADSKKPADPTSGFDNLWNTRRYFGIDSSSMHHIGFFLFFSTEPRF